MGYVYAGSIIGHESGNKPVPMIVKANRHLLERVRSVIDIGAGTGRFVKIFMEYTPDLEEYVAIEPCPKFTARLRRKYSSWKPLTVVEGRWEDVRDMFIDKEYDVVVLWDVVMYMDLRVVYPDARTPLEAVLKEIPVWINMTRKYFLFSLHPVKYTLIPSREFPKIYRRIEEGTARKKVIPHAKSYLNRFYVVKERS